MTRSFYVIRRTEMIATYVVMCFILVIDKITWRFGRPYTCAGIDYQWIRPYLEPGMIILTRKNFNLSNLFIKGYWKHTSIVTDREHIIEATSEGVIKTSVYRLLSKSDDLVILKPLFCDHLSMMRASEKAEKVLGYPYNFLFRKENGSFYCSELVCWAYTTVIPMGNSWEMMRWYHEGKYIYPHYLYETKSIWEVVYESTG
ncbi:MAG: YiiX/YebB-like N1pC/P60 family cysteine hydrolase [Bacteroidetes bacterium]|nr:YiiX/YebB-like N1pC/P60 family cysteine hydrolase [Bacteroidota bacterium]